MEITAQEHIGPDLRRVAVQRPARLGREMAASAGKLPADLCPDKIDLTLGMKTTAQEHSGPDLRRAAVQRPARLGRKLAASAVKLPTDPRAAQVNRAIAAKLIAQVDIPIAAQSPCDDPARGVATWQKQRAQPCIQEADAVRQQAAPKTRSRSDHSPWQSSAPSIQAPTRRTPFGCGRCPSSPPNSRNRISPARTRRSLSLRSGGRSRLPGNSAILPVRHASSSAASSALHFRLPSTSSSVGWYVGVCSIPSP